tara:strand:+ start:487 stop:696 length:210 start_codon:yes stop_codon:yes gene_type:complete
MNIKLKDKDKPISLSSGWCFMKAGFDSGLIEKINSGKQVKVDKIPKPASDYVEEVKKQPKKNTKPKGGE